MGWNSVIGQERVKNLLRRSIERQQLAHAYLFYGARGTGKQAMAIEFAKTVLCERGKSESCGECASCKKMMTLQHPDLNLVFPLPAGEGEKTGDDPIDVLEEEQIDEIREEIALKAKDPYHEIQISKANFIKINSVRNVRRNSAYTSVEGKWKVFLICDADKMNDQASNSLLKTLEEPTENTLLVLTSSEKDRLAPTIVSRCQLVQFPFLQDDEIAEALRTRNNVPPEEALLKATLAQGSYTQACELISANLKEEKKDVLNFIRVSLGWNGVSRVQLIDELASSRNKNRIEHWLKVLQTWLRDAMVLRDAPNSWGQGREMDPDMQSFVGKFPGANLEQAIGAVDNCISLVRRNVYLHLLLTTLSFDLKKTLGQTKS